MGGRGASSGISRSGNKYGTEYSTLYQSGNIKFIKQNGVKNAKTPLETMTDGRVYVSVIKMIIFLLFLITIKREKEQNKLT